MPAVLCFGDSNTHGTPPILTLGESRRYDAATRWPGVARAALGPGWEVVEEGLPGRTAQFADPVMGAHMQGAEGLKIALASHGPLDLLTIMLGTNDSKTRFCATPEVITGGIAGLLDIAQHRDMQARHGGFRILLIAPPAVQERGPIKDEFLGAAAKSAALAPLYQALATARGLGFLDAGKLIATSPIDGVHFDERAHEVLGRAVAASLRTMV